MAIFLDQRLPVFGYHGTTLSRAKKVKELGVRHFYLSTNIWDWLGDGIYFFQDAPFRAYQWALDRAAREQDEASVIKARINLRDCIDLLDIKWWRFFALTYGKLKERYGDDLQDQPRLRLVKKRDGSLSIDVENGRFGYNTLDYEVTNEFVGWLLEHEKKDVKAVRAAFFEGKEAYPTTYLFDKSHVQVAVKDPRSIEEISLISTKNLEIKRKIYKA